MRRLARRLLTVLTAFSLLLCLATLAAAARSHFASEAVEFQPLARPDRPDYALGWSRRGVSLAIDDQYYEGAHWHFDTSSPNDDPYGDTVFDLAGVRLSKSAPDWQALTLPYWLLILLTVILPARWLRRTLLARRRRQRADAGQCPSCSYDLTGNLSGVCPECGSKVQ